MMDIASLAQAVTALLVPVLPQLLKLGESVGDELLKNTVDAGWDGAKEIWAKLHPPMAAKPAALDAAHDAAAAADDPDAVAALRLQIKKLLTDDPALAASVSEILRQRHTQTTPVTASGHRSVAVGGSVQGGVIVTGDQNRVGRPDSEEPSDA